MHLFHNRERKATLKAWAPKKEKGTQRLLVQAKLLVELELEDFEALQVEPEGFARAFRQMKTHAGIGRYDLRLLLGGESQAAIAFVNKDVALDKEPVVEATPLPRRKEVSQAWLPALDTDDNHDFDGDHDEEQDIDEAIQRMKAWMALDVTLDVDDAEPPVYAALHRYLGETIAVEFDSRKQLEAELEQLFALHRLRDLFVIGKFSTPAETIDRFVKAVFLRRDFDTDVVRPFYETVGIWRAMGDIRLDVDLDSAVAVAKEQLPATYRRLWSLGLRFSCVPYDALRQVTDGAESTAAVAG